MPTLDPRGDYLTRVWRDGVYPLAEELGVTMKLPPVQPRSRLAHEAAKWATTINRFDDYNEAIFRAFFERGENIEKIDVLVTLAENLNLDADELRGALEEHEFEPQIMNDESEAAALGVHAVPAFVANRRTALSGVQSLSALQTLIVRAKTLP